MAAYRNNIADSRIDRKMWATSARWGRKIHVSRKVFESYLEELGYICGHSEQRSMQMVTDKGHNHSREQHLLLGKVVLWDKDAFFDVMELRAKNATVYIACPNCKVIVDSTKLDSSLECEICGTAFDYSDLIVEFDR